MIDVSEITRAAKLRRLRAPSAPAAQMHAASPEPSPVMPHPDPRRDSPSVLESLMKRHDRIHERHLKNG